MLVLTQLIHKLGKTAIAGRFSRNREPLISKNKEILDFHRNLQKSIEHYKLLPYVKIPNIRTQLCKISNTAWKK